MTVQLNEGLFRCLYLIFILAEKLVITLFETLTLLTALCTGSILFISRYKHQYGQQGNAVNYLNSELR